MLVNYLHLQCVTSYTTQIFRKSLSYPTTERRSRI